MRKSIVVPLALSSLALLAACDMSGSVIDGDSSSSVPSMMESSSSADESVSSVASDDSTAGARVIDMTATDWEFSPPSITASVGEKIVVRVTGIAGKHSFAIADLGINVPIEPGETKDIELPTDTAGTFAFRCRIPCGPGHKDMMGTFTVS